MTLLTPTEQATLWSAVQSQEFFWARKITVTDEDDFLHVKRVLAGDRRAFEPLVRKHERRVFRVTLAVLGNIEDAEEAMQVTFVKVMSANPDFVKSLGANGKTITIAGQLHDQAYGKTTCYRPTSIPVA